MTRSKTLDLPNTLPGGMVAHVHTVPVPVVDDRVIIGPIEMPMREFCLLVEHVLTATKFKPNDPRRALREGIELSRVVDDRVVMPDLATV